MYVFFQVKNKQKSPLRVQNDSSALYSPKSSLRVMHEVGISYEGHKKLRNRAAKEGKPPLLASRRKLDFERKSLEDGVEYVIDQDIIRLQSINTAVMKRLEHIGRNFGLVIYKNIGPNVNQTGLLSVDKGQGRVLVTLAFPYRNQDKNVSLHPCSDSNHLILMSWIGADKYDALDKRIKDIHRYILLRFISMESKSKPLKTHIYRALKEELELDLFVAGDLGFLCTLCGAHSSMAQPCPFCPHSFDKSHTSDKDRISYVPVVLPKKPKAKERKDPIWSINFDDVGLELDKKNLRIGCPSGVAHKDRYRK